MNGAESWRWSTPPPSWWSLAPRCRRPRWGTPPTLSSSLPALFSRRQRICSGTVTTLNYVVGNENFRSICGLSVSLDYSLLDRFLLVFFYFKWYRYALLCFESRYEVGFRKCLETLVQVNQDHIVSILIALVDWHCICFVKCNSSFWYKLWFFFFVTFQLCLVSWKRVTWFCNIETNFFSGSGWDWNPQK